MTPLSFNAEAIMAQAQRPSATASLSPTDTSEAGLRAIARSFEAEFLSQMLDHAGLGKTPETFGGGAGEDAFSSFLTRAYADELAESGQLGLTESIVRALSLREASNG